MHYGARYEQEVMALDSMEYQAKDKGYGSSVGAFMGPGVGAREKPCTRNHYPGLLSPLFGFTPFSPPLRVVLVHAVSDVTFFRTTSKDRSSGFSFYETTTRSTIIQNLLYDTTVSVCLNECLSV